VDWMHLAYYRDQWLTFMKRVMNVQVPYKVGNFLTNQVTVSFSSRPLLHVFIHSFNWLVGWLVGQQASWLVMLDGRSI
jgi:hypothetical protein